MPYEIGDVFEPLTLKTIGYSIEEQKLIVTTRANQIASQEAACSPFFICAADVRSQTKADANSPKTMKASSTPRVTLPSKFTCKVGLCFDPSGRATLLGG